VPSGTVRFNRAATPPAEPAAGPALSWPGRESTPSNRSSRTRAVLEEQGQLAEVRLERWDPAGEEWRDPEEPDEPKDRPGPGRLRSTATALLKGAAQAAMYGDF
jgi:hypothetical protein